MKYFTTYQNQGIRYIIFMCGLLLLVSSCKTQKYLKEGETLLKDNDIVFTKKSDVDNWRNLRDELKTLAYQKPNSKRFGSFRRWVYYRGQRKGNKEFKRLKKFQSALRRFSRKWIAQEPAVYDADLANGTAEKMKRYLSDRGYFQADVEFHPKATNRKKTRVVYDVTTNKRYYFDTIIYSSQDTAIHEILQKLKAESLIKKDEPVDVSIYNDEVRRVTTYLKDEGYANFFTQYIPPLNGDSTDQKVNAEFRVLLNKDSSSHKIYRIGDISVNLFYNPRDTSSSVRDTIVNGIHFTSSNGKFYIKPQSLTPKIFFKKNDVYKLSDIEKTRKQFGDLDIFQFVELKRLPHPELENVLNYEIRLIPKKRMQLSTSFEVNNSRILISNRSFLGVAASLNYKNRNLFRGGEIFNTRLEGGIELNPVSREINNWDLNLGTDFYFPKLMDYPLGTSKIIRKFSESAYTLLKEQAKTKVSLNYNIVSSASNTAGTYQINIFAGSWGYDWKNPKNNARYALNQIGINFLDPNFDQDFRDSVLVLNPFLQNSLNEQLFTGFIARDFTILLQSKVDRKGRSTFFRGNIEQSGAEIAAINGIYNTLSSSTEADTFRFLGNKYEFSQYLRLELDGRYNWKQSSKTTWAFRTHFGIATPFAFSDDVPYTKQFSVGGPTSMRGWRIRELGPGGYEAPTTVGAAFFQTGDLKLEMNAEFRYDIWWIFKLAFFVDAGNVWALGQDERENSSFGLNRFAINSGVGLRMDFSIFLFRLDFGLQVRNPFPDDTGRYWIVRKPVDITMKENWNPNIAIGYPF